MDAHAAPSRTLWSIGHSNHPIERVLELLGAFGIEALVDVRSAPYSRYSPQFGREALAASVAGAGVKYVYLGEELGGRPGDARYRDDAGRVLYDKLGASALFLSGIERLERGVDQYRCAIMCSEEDPRVCHRHVLVSRILNARGMEVRHIRGDGRCETFGEVQDGLAKRKEPSGILWSASA